mgnify:CR=1 FL=1
MRRFYHFFVLLLVLTGLISNNSFAQNGFRSADGWGTGWSTTDYWVGTGFGTTYGKTYQNTSGSGNRYFRLHTDWGGNQRTHGPIESDCMTASDEIITIGSQKNLDTWGGCKAYYINVSNTTDRYVFRTRFGDGINNTPKMVVFRVQGAIQIVQTVSQSPTSTAVTSSAPVIITSNLSGTLSTGQGVYLRFTTDNWFSSTIIPMTGSNTTYTASIPPQTSGTVVKYYVFTSGSGLTIGHGDADFYTINGNTNNGTNYQYIVLTSNSAVSVTPSNPTDNVPVTITFNASGTALAGVTKVYLHSGVSSTESSPTTFNHTIGHWGQDDGIGLMTNTGGNTWSISITAGLRSYYNVPSEKDIFGINFLFRSADGTLKEDNNGSNFFNTVNPGNYFKIISPANNPQFSQVGSTLSIDATTPISPAIWTLDQIDPLNGNLIQNLVTGNINDQVFTYSLPIINTNQRKFRISADYGSGIIKVKTFVVQGFNLVNIASKPEGTKPGINYHLSDATKATLVLHAPKYTRYLKGTGTEGGTNTSAPKNVVYVVGDFNNWTPSEAYKLNRDTVMNGVHDRGDYWWITLDGLTPGQEYVFQYLIDGSIRVADPYTHKVSDPDDWQIPASVYPNLITYRPQAVDRASVLQTNKPQYNWTAPSFTKPTTDRLNIYELHFRDFTEEGTYLKAIEKLDYIKGLGINAIHVMPVSEFEGNSSWGYNPNFYFAADKAYGTENDLKFFVDECHKRQIQVFNDVVLNHAFYSNVMAKMYWNTLENKPANDNPWFNPNHKMVRNTGGHWGADWNHESEHVQNMVDSILGYWLKEFKFDGFRFDFTKGFGQTDPNAFPQGDEWASAKNEDRIDLLKRMVDRMWNVYPGSVAIFEHLANSDEDRILANHGILMWSGVGHHNDLKRFVLGYPDNDPNIYNSGLYNAPDRAFSLQNWMSYGESHDEERLGYELMQYYNGTKNTPNMIDRLKIAYGFNLLLPGPRMLWQFGELGYEVSINFNGRTGEKPVRWYYYDEPKRRELYRFISYLFQIRNRYNLYPVFPDNTSTFDAGNIGLGAADGLNTPRIMRLSTVDGKHAIIISNLHTTQSKTLTNVLYDVTGTWYKYNGTTVVDGQQFIVTNTSSDYPLLPSETVLLTNFPLDFCTNVTKSSNDGDFSLRYALECAIEGETITLDDVIPSSTINLTEPIILNKNITIRGLLGANINIDGSFINGQSLFQIMAGKSITIENVDVKCSQGNINGRCLLNNGGNIILKDVEFIDSTSNTSGNTVYNSAGTIDVQNNLTIKRQ